MFRPNAVTLACKFRTYRLMQDIANGGPLQPKAQGSGPDLRSELEAAARTNPQLARALHDAGQRCTATHPAQGRPQRG